MSQKRKFVPVLEVEKTPSGTLRANPDEAVLLEYTPAGGHLRVWKPPTTPEASTSSGDPPAKKSRRGLSFSLGDNEIANVVMDSGSEDEECSDSDEDEIFDFRAALMSSRHIREEIINELEGDNDLTVRECEEGVAGSGVIGNVEVKGESPQVYANLEDFSWSDDFSTFSGQEETYLRTPGTILETQDPVEIFMAFWDERIMEEIVKETNRYAWQHIAPFSETEGGIPEYLNSWFDTTVGEMYRYFAMNILMSLCYRSVVADYWVKDPLGMPEFRNYMSRNRFSLITKFLHFVNNEYNDPILSSYEKKLFKIRPIVEHCNERFNRLYTPNKHLSLDESLLLWKGRLSWAQCIRTKAARFGIKSFELCESVTGYQLRCLFYAGKDSSMSEGPIHGFESSTAKVVLELMDGFLDVGHTLVMDNWYNQLPMTRFLKRRRTDVIGTINPRHRRANIPNDIKGVNAKRMARGDQVARHCGDISLVAWKDVKLVTAVSTYHIDQQLPARRAGVAIRKPEVIVTYNKYMGGVDSKDQKLSMFLMERKRGKKWYMKVFKRLLNTSLLNAYIIYKKNPVLRVLSHRGFRRNVAFSLLDKFPKTQHSQVLPSLSYPADRDAQRLLKTVNHYVEQTEKVPGKNSHKQLRCVRCTAAGRRTVVTIMCNFCKAPLCPGRCWADFHDLKNLK